MQKQRGDNPYFNRRKLELFGGIFLVSFVIFFSLGVVFPQARNLLHRSAGLFGVSVVPESSEKTLLGESYFSDVSLSDPNAEAIMFLRKRGIVSGYEDGSFRPSQPLTRAELMKLIVKAQNIEPHLLRNSGCFKDVQIEWFAPSICFAKQKGWVKGYDDNTFRPFQNITLSEAQRMVFQSFGISDEEVSRIQNLPKDATHEMTRAEIAELLAQVIAIKGGD